MTQPRETTKKQMQRDKRRSTMRIATAFLLATWSLVSVTHAFVPLVGFGTRKQAMPRFLASSGDGDSSYEKALARNKARTDVRNFLTQRSIQSFITLLIETRDPHTVTWMEDFGGWKNLENYHGSGALNMTTFPTWDTVFLEMMEQPMGVVVVRAKRRGRGHGGWSKNNPYLEERFVEFEIDIDPVSLVSRIISVREQLAEEFAHDLDTFILANEQILQSYHDRARDDLEGDDASSSAYDRTAMAMGAFGIFNAKAPSPLRKGNFDLLVLLVTQESVHRILRQYREESNDQFDWLLEFYSDRVSKYFDGDGEYSRADDFLEEVLLTPPSVKKNASGKADLIDPLRIAEDIIRMRRDVALDFKEAMEHVPQDHSLQVRKVLLTKQMQKWGNAPEPSSLAGETTETKGTEGGEFE